MGNIMIKINFIDIFLVVLDFLVMLVPLLVMIAISTLLERKVMAAMQRRKGPNVVGVFGILQPIADGVKLLAKEFVVLTNSRKLLFVFSPGITFFIALLMWVIMPIPSNTAISGLFDIELGILLLLALSTLNVYGIIMAGWASNSFYAFLGALRASAQMISYEVVFALCLLPVVLITRSFNLREIVMFQINNGCWNIFIVSPAALLFFIAMLAETNRTPFDLPEAEGELVAGFNVEYSAIFFALFFLAEYSNMLLMSTLFTLLFLGGWSFFGMVSPLIFSIKVCFIFFCFVWVRATLPRYRYDQLIRLGWRVILPITMGYFLFVSGTVFMVSKIF
jgi:NADH-quinone oxidoreductase subunit H